MYVVVLLYQSVFQPRSGVVMVAVGRTHGTARPPSIYDRVVVE